MPKCLGKFKDINPVLHSIVCDECNQYFGNNLDNCLGRDSLEGIARYRIGIKPKKEPKYKRLILRVDKGHKLKGLYVIPTFPTGGRKNDIELDTQVEIYNIEKNEYHAFRENEIPEKSELDRLKYDLTNKEMRFYGDYEKLLKIMRNKGMEVKITKRVELNVDKIIELIPVLIQARIDRTISRGLCKIVFNYFACHLKKIILRDDFNTIREFIRYDSGNVNDFFNITEKPIYYKELKLKKRWLPGHIIVIERKGNAFVGRLAIYNSIVRLTYEITLCRNYSGIWFPFDEGHYFDPIDKTITKLIPFNFIEPA